MKTRFYILLLFLVEFSIVLCASNPLYVFQQDSVTYVVRDAFTDGTDLLPSYDVQIDGIYYNLYYNMDGSIFSAEVTNGEYPYSGNVIIPSSIIVNNQSCLVTGINSRAFTGDTILSIVIPPSISHIHSRTFWGCSLNSVVINSDSICQHKNMKYWFGPKNKIRKCIIGDNVTSIAKSFFEQCNYLQYVKIGQNIHTIHSNAFKACKSLDTVQVDNISTWCHINFENTEANPLHYSHKLFVQNTPLTKLVLSNDIQNVTNYAFQDCNSLECIYVNDSIDSIETMAFANCTQLKNIHFSKGVRYIGDKAFVNCAQLKRIHLSGNVQYIGNDVFANCTQLKNVHFPKNVQDIGKDIFKGCTNLPIKNGIRYADSYLVHLIDTNKSDIRIASKTRYIGEYAFLHAHNILSLSIHRRIRLIGEHAFSNIPNIIISNRKLAENKGALAINGYVEGDLVYADSSKIEFLGCNRNVISVSLPNTVVSIGHRAFASCQELTSVTIPESVLKIGSRAFLQCKSLTMIVFPSSLEHLDEINFLGCDKLQYIRFLGTTPPKYHSVYLSNNLRQILLYVPIGSKKVYEENSAWKCFSEIIEDSKK
ncbi:MAG: leucine-rich repeat domain-containing protein [Bacteroidales bacterium]|nr:leucine-rich repeat domain-containing protein [Candidatus Colicola equi]